MNKFSKVLKKAKSFAVMAERAEQEYKKVFAQTSEIEEDKPFLLDSRNLFEHVNNFKSYLTNVLLNLRSINKIIMDQGKNSENEVLFGVNSSSSKEAYYSNNLIRDFISLASGFLNDKETKSYLKIYGITSSLEKLIKFGYELKNNSINEVLSGLEKQLSAMQKAANKVKQFADVKTNWKNTDFATKSMEPGLNQTVDDSEKIINELNRKPSSPLPSSAPKKPSKPLSNLSS